MSHVELVEARRLLAITPTPDVTFADGGHLSFSGDNPVNDVLATHGEIYVRVYQRPRDRIVVFKYDDSGALDKTWGRGGYIVPQTQDDFTMVRDPRTGGLLLGAADAPYDDTKTPIRIQSSTVSVERYTAAGALDTAWGRGGRVAYTEATTELTLGRLIALPHKRVLLALDRQQQRGEEDQQGYIGHGGADDVVLLKFDAHGRYDRAFNNGHALAVVTGHYKAVTTDDADQYTTQTVEDYTTPTFGDIQFFADNSVRVVSTREETHQTITTDNNNDSSNTVGKTVLTAESTAVTADGRVLAKQSASYTLKRFATGVPHVTTRYYRVLTAVASADGNGIAVLGEAIDSSGGTGSSLMRIGPGYRTKPEALPAPFDSRYFGTVTRTDDGTILAQSSGTNDFGDHDEPVPGPGVLSLGRDLAVGRHKVFTPLTYFPSFTFGVTLDDTGRLLVEATNTKNETFDVTRYA